MLNPDDIKDMGLTYDDVLLEPQYSEVLPAMTDLRTRLTKNISLNIPFMSAPMDTVTESDMAIALARAGGVGVIHKILGVDKQVAEVKKVKRSANGVIRNPSTVAPNAMVCEVDRMMVELGISGVPVLDENGKLVGLVTRRDLQFAGNREASVTEVMTTAENLVTHKGDLSLNDAEAILKEHKVEKLLILDENDNLNGLVTIRDVAMLQKYPDRCCDDLGRLRVGASVGMISKEGESERIERLIAEDVDFLVVDSAHGHSKNVISTVRWIKERHSDVDVIAGNVATYEGAKALVDAGADAVKVGIGPGSICTTRVVSGVGVPQLTAVARAVKAVEGTDVTVIADGGIRFSGDVVKAIAAGADVVMIGSLFAGFDESPGEKILQGGRYVKSYRGMGSVGAMVLGSGDRYNQGDKKDGKYVPEGVEAVVPYKGKVSDCLYQLCGGVRAGMGYCGANTFKELREKAKFIRISPATVRENHPHDISISKEAPNYSPGSGFGG